MLIKYFIEGNLEQAEELWIVKWKSIYFYGWKVSSNQTNVLVYK